MEAAIEAGIEAASEGVSSLPAGQKAWDRKEYMIAETAARKATTTERERCSRIVQKAVDTWWVDFSPDAGDLRAMVREINGDLEE
jgi:hypothetical protein